MNIVYIYITDYKTICMIVFGIQMYFYLLSSGGSHKNPRPVIINCIIIRSLCNVVILVFLLPKIVEDYQDLIFFFHSLSFFIVLFIFLFRWLFPTIIIAVMYLFLLTFPGPRFTLRNFIFFYQYS